MNILIVFLLTCVFVGVFFRWQNSLVDRCLPIFQHYTEKDLTVEQSGAQVEIDLNEDQDPLG